MSKTILVGLDGSEISEKALDAAVGIAHSGDTIVLVNVIEWAPTEDYPAEILNEWKTYSRERILAPNEKRVRDAGIAVRSELRIGHPAKEFQTLAEGADLIVIGKTGYSGLQRILLGSHADKIIRLSEVPVLVVP